MSIDVDALRRAAESSDGDTALVTRSWLRAVLADVVDGHAARQQLQGMLTEQQAGQEPEL